MYKFSLFLSGIVSIQDNGMKSTFLVYYGCMKRNTCICLVLALAIILITLVITSSSEKEDSFHYYNEIHIHADIAVYLNGTKIDFSTDEYQSNENIARHPFLHLHGNDSDVLHIHANDQTLASFFISLGMSLTEHCFSARDTTAYCADDGLRMFVNDIPYTEPFGTYTPNDLDRILITTQQDAEKLQQELQSVTDKACIQSGSCPERGEAMESCSSAVGCAVPPKIEPLNPYTTVEG